MKACESEKQIEGPKDNEGIPEKRQSLKE